MAAGSQGSIITAVRRRIERALVRIDSSTLGLSDPERKAIVAEVRVAIIDIRKMEGTIQDPAAWQEIHTLVDKLEVRLSEYLISN